MLTRGSSFALPAVVAVVAVVLVGCQSASERSEGPASASEADFTPPASVEASSAPDQSVAVTAEPPDTQDPALMDLSATSCPGGVVLEWTPSTHGNFHHYTALRSPEEEISTDYPPIAPAVDWGETYATDPFVTSAVDASVLPSDRTWSYRVMAYDILGDAVSASPVRQAQILEVVDLGTPTVETDGDITTISWSPFTGDAACFTAYRVLSGAGGPPSAVLSEVSDPDVVFIDTDAIHAGITYQLRIDAVRVTTLGNLVSGRSATVFYTLP